MTSGAVIPVLAVALGGCALQPDIGPTPAACLMEAPRMTMGIQAEGDVELRWRVVSHAQLFEHCRTVPLRAYGCTFTDEARHTAVIYLDDAIGFGNGCKLMQLGHEVVHAMGAKHGASQ